VQYLIFLLFFIGCSAQIKFDELIGESNHYDEIFVEAKLRSGSHRFILKKKSRTVLKGELDWNVENHRTYQMEMVSPLGQEVFFVSVLPERQVRTHGLSHKLNLVIAEDSELSLSGESLGIKYDELASFLQGSFPRQWLFLTGGVVKGRKEDIIHLQDNKRNIKIELAKDKKYQCAEIIWDKFLFLKNTIRICYQRKGKKIKTFININDDFYLTLDPLD
jgi:hypothetical protein